MARERCPFAECGLAGSIAMEAALKVWQSVYCEGGFTRCERYKLLDSGLGVPRRLLPNGRLLEGPRDGSDGDALAKAG